MLVTIFADASFHMESQCAGWAGWAKSTRATISGSGPIKHQVASAGEAEMCAIVNAVHIAIKKGAAMAGDILLIESDCLDALGALERRTPLSSPKGRTLHGKRWVRKRKRRQTIIDVFAKVTEGYELRFKHVKGHQDGSKCARSFINNECDRNAKRHMRAERQRKRQKVYDAVAREKKAEVANALPQTP